MEEERRRNDDRWRGSIDSEVSSLKSEVAALRSTTAQMSTGITRLQGELQGLRREVSESRDEVREAAGKINKGREDAVETLTAEIAAKHAEGIAWKLGLRQIIVGCLLTAVLTVICSLIVLVVSGQL